MELPAVDEEILIITLLKQFMYCQVFNCYYTIKYSIYNFCIV